MILYRQQRQTVLTRLLLREVQRQIDGLRRVHLPPRDSLLAALIDAGELASAVADARAPYCDTVDVVSDACLGVVVDLATAVNAHRDRSSVTVHHALENAARATERCDTTTLPVTAPLGVSEGFAYYALGPELYSDAASRWADRIAPSVVWCIGLRTIGLTLAAVVAATLQHRGIAVYRTSLRPRGHPFDRQTSIDDGLKRALTAAPDAWWLIVDEGPGISGSSMAGTARCLVECGVPTERIVLMPSYRPDVARVASTTRRYWETLAIAPASFESTWLESGELAHQYRAQKVHDLSSGAWRSMTILETPAPAVNPQHERRKYLVQKDSDTTLIKFSGYGRYGQRLAARAAEGAEAGWNLAPLGARDGWLEFPWLQDRFGVMRHTPADLQRLADYVAFIARTRSSDWATDTEELLGMTLANVREVCGDAAARAVEALPVTEPAAAVVVDGQLRAHEWVRRDGVLLKTDGIEHGDNHFFPGPCDVAWDVAGAINEWQLDIASAAHFVGAYARATGDVGIAHRLPFYRVAHLAFRAAYTAFSRQQVAAGEAALFAAEHRRYRHQLEALLPCGS